MLKFVLCFSLLLGTVKTSDTSSRVDKIEYSAKDYESGILKLRIELVSDRDVMTLKVDFYDSKNTKLNNYYTSSLIVEGRQNTIARIPVSIKEKMYMHIKIISFNEDKELVDIKMPLYPFGHQVCYLIDKHECKSKYPSIVKYENNRVNEEYEVIGLVNKNLNLYSYDNLLPIEKIKVVTNLHKLDDGYAMLNIEDYTIPIRIENKNSIINFEIANKYYLDVKNGNTYDYYMSDTIYKNQIIFPYENMKYDFVLQLKETFISFDEVVIPFSVNTFNRFIGKCSESIYCVRRLYL